MKIVPLPFFAAWIRAKYNDSFFANQIAAETYGKVHEEPMFKEKKLRTSLLLFCSLPYFCAAHVGRVQPSECLHLVTPFLAKIAPGAILLLTRSCYTPCHAIVTVHRVQCAASLDSIGHI